MSAGRVPVAACEGRAFLSGPDVQLRRAVAAEEDAAERLETALAALCAAAALRPVVEGRLRRERRPRLRSPLLRALAALDSLIDAGEALVAGLADAHARALCQLHNAGGRSVAR